MPCPSLAVRFGPGVVSSRANLAASTHSLWCWRVKKFPEEEIQSQKDRQPGLGGTVEGKGQSTPKVLGSFSSPLEGTVYLAQQSLHQKGI